MAGSAEELVSLLVLEELDVDLFRGMQADTERQRVFGGQVAAQSVVAANRSVDDAFVMHSLHSYFLRPGDPAGSVRPASSTTLIVTPRSAVPLPGSRRPASAGASQAAAAQLSVRP